MQVIFNDPPGKCECRRDPNVMNPRDSCGHCLSLQPGTWVRWSWSSHLSAALLIGVPRRFMRGSVAMTAYHT